MQSCCCQHIVQAYSFQLSHNIFKNTDLKYIELVNHSMTIADALFGYYIYFGMKWLHKNYSVSYLALQALNK